MKKLLLIFTFFVAYFALPPDASACSCLLRVVPAGKSEAESKRMEEKFQKNRLKETDAVFLGRVVSSTFNAATTGDAQSYYAVKFKLERSWKDTSTAEITVFTPADSCFRYNFSVGETFLVYAKKPENSGDLWTNSCAGNLPAESATDVLKFIGKGRKIKPA